MNPHTLLDKNGNPSSRKLTQSRAELIASTPWMLESATLAERLWNVINEKTRYEKLCKSCAAPVKFQRWGTNYEKDHCSNSCWHATRNAQNALIEKPIKAKLTKEQRLEKQTSSNLKKYGVKWPWLRQDFILARSERVKNVSVGKWLDQLNTRGLTPLFTAKDYLDGDASREKLRVRCSCGTEFHIQRYKEKSTPGLCPTCYTPNASRWQHEVNDFVRSLGVKTRLNDRKTLSGKYELDIFMPDNNMAIECDGVWWHSEGGRPDMKNAMLLKHAAAKDAMIKLLCVFDYEWAEHVEIIKSRIRSAVNCSVTKKHARKLRVAELTNAQSADFFEKTHLQGACVGRTFALMEDDTVISAMSFAKPRWGKEDLEMIRFSSALNHTVMGGASKLFTHAVKELNAGSVISYADLRFGTGGTYGKLGFICAGETGPGHFYTTSNGRRMSRYQLQKKKLDSVIGVGAGTALQRCAAAGWFRVWTPGNSRWIWTKG